MAVLLQRLEYCQAGNKIMQSCGRRQTGAGKCGRIQESCFAGFIATRGCLQLAQSSGIALLDVLAQGSIYRWVRPYPCHVPKPTKLSRSPGVEGNSVAVRVVVAMLITPAFQASNVAVTVDDPGRPAPHRSGNPALLATRHNKPKKHVGNTPGTRNTM